MAKKINKYKCLLTVMITEQTKAVNSSQGHEMWLKALEEI